MLAQEIPASFIDKTVDKRANMSLGYNERIRWSKELI
jgi:hypothetical protein